jgi:hypothetical protein
MEHDHRPLVRRQPAKATLELVPHGDGDCRVGIEPRFDWDQSNVRGPATIAPRFGIAGVDDEPTEPGVKLPGFLERWEVAPRPEEGLLGGVLGALWVAKDPIREGVAVTGVGGREPSERILVAPACSLDQIRLLHLDPSVGRAGMAASLSMEPAAMETFKDRDGTLPIPPHHLLMVLAADGHELGRLHPYTLGCRHE